MSITPPKTHDQLMEVAARLSNAAPNTWAEFVRTFGAYTDARKDGCVQAPADRILITQGKAQQCVELFALFTNAIKK